MVQLALCVCAGVVFCVSHALASFRALRTHITPPPLCCILLVCTTVPVRVSIHLLNPLNHLISIECRNVDCEVGREV